MKTLMIFGSIVCLLSISIVGCTRYLEEETPAGIVPAPIPPAAPTSPPGTSQDQPFRQAGIGQAAPGASSYSPYIGRPLSGAERAVSEEAYAASIARFQKAYTAAGSPRIAIYFNRALSDEVREWMTPTREVLTGTGQKVSAGQSGTTVVTPEGAVIETGKQTKVEGSEDKERGLQTYQQTHIEEAKRQSPPEEWMWRFEDIFLQPYLKAGAKIVDRATMLRLVAATSGKQGEPYSLNAVKKIEMDALKEYADIYVEMLVARDATSPTGYAFKASAKQTKDGIIVGSTAKTGRDYRYEKAYEAITTPTGYELRKGSPALILENVSTETSVDLMNSMANFWEKQTPAAETKK